MMSPRANMAFAAVLCAGLVAMLSGFVSGKLVKPKILHEDAVKVEAAESGAGGGVAKVAMPEPILAMIATADIERGKAVAKACAACHKFEKGGANGVGPGLWGVVGNKKDSHAGYAYSGALSANGAPAWTYESLNKFLWKPKAYAADTKMNFIGVKKPEDRAALIAYLRTVDDVAEPLPTDAAIAAEIVELSPPPAEAELAPVDPAKAAPVAVDGVAVVPPVATDMAKPLVTDAVAEEKPVTPVIPPVSKTTKP